jgi:hypothetical protein
LGHPQIIKIIENYLNNNQAKRTVATTATVRFIIGDDFSTIFRSVML